jgi:hypothetical protein
MKAPTRNPKSQISNLQSPFPIFPLTLPQVSVILKILQKKSLRSAWAMGEKLCRGLVTAAKTDTD